MKGGQDDDVERVNQETEITAEILDVIQSADGNSGTDQGTQSGTGRTAIEFSYARGSFATFEEHTSQLIKDMLIGEDDD